MVRYPPTAKYEKSRRQVRARNITRVAVLGDETNNIYSDRLSFYFAREIMGADDNGNALLGPVFYLRANPAASVLPRPGRGVLYKKNDRDEYQIERADSSDLDEQKIDQRALEPNDAMRAFRNLFEIVNLNSYSIDSGLLVNVFPWQYHTADNVVRFFGGTDAATQVDLADNDFIGPSAVTAGRTEIVPSTANKRRFALLAFNITKHLADDYPLEVYPGAAVDIVPNESLTIDEDLQTCYDVLPADEIVVPIKAYYLEEGQTKIAGISKDVDVRQFINVNALGSGIALTSEDNSVTITEDPVGTFNLSVNFPAPTPDTEISSPDSTIAVSETAPNVFEIDVADGAIDTDKLADDAVTNDKMADLAVTTPKIANQAITLAKLVNGTARKVVGFDLAGAAAEKDLAIDIPATWGESMAGALPGAVYYDVSTDRWHKAVTASFSATVSGIRGLISDLGASNGAVDSEGSVRVLGPLGGFSGLTPGQDLFLSSIAGGLTQTQPSFSSIYFLAESLFVIPYGRAIDAFTVFVDARQPAIYRMWRYMVPGDAAQIDHFPDITLARRVIAKTITYTDTLQISNPNSNQDVDVQLRGQSLAGQTITVDNAGVNVSILGDSGGTEFRVAQSILVSVGGRITSVSVRFGANTGTPLGLVTLSICGAGTNPGAALASVTFAPNPNADNVIPIPNGPIISAGVTPWVMLEPPAQATGNSWSVLRGTNPYASGQMKQDANNAGTWAALAAGSDMRCAVTVSAIAPYSQLAQIYASTAHRPQRIRVWLKKVGAPTGTLTLYLYSVPAGTPDTINYTSTNTVLASSLSTSYAWVDFYFDVGIRIGNGVERAIVLGTTDASSGTNYVVWGADFSSPSTGGLYGYGEAVATPGTWTALSPSNGSLIYELYAKGTQIQKLISGSHVIEYGFNGSNKDTQTTVINPAASSIETICDVIL
jgi:hypothetical protein